MSVVQMIDKVKVALRLTTDAYDDELNGIIEAAKLDLNIAGVPTETLDALQTMAVVTYCRVHFGSPEDFDKLKASYDEQKAQLMSATGYGQE